MRIPVRIFVAAAVCGLPVSLMFPAAAQDAPAFVPVPPPQESAAGAPVRLEEISSRGNAITDVDGWWTRNGLESPFLPVPLSPIPAPGVLPPEVAVRAGENIAVTAGRDGEGVFAIYGQDFSRGALVALYRPDSSGRLTRTHALDFSGWFTPQFRIWWVQRRGDTLYFNYGINGYASEVEGRTAFLAAVDLSSHRTVWRSAPLVSNSRNFVIVGDSIVTGYGFTAEPDHLYVIDCRTGRTTSKAKVASAPEFLVLRDDRLFVRCYNRDYVFRVVK